MSDPPTEHVDEILANAGTHNRIASVTNQFAARQHVPDHPHPRMNYYADGANQSKTYIGVHLTNTRTNWGSAALTPGSG